MGETIRVSETVKEALETIRDDGGHTNMDSAIREVFNHSDIDLYELTKENGGLESVVESEWTKD